LIIPIAVILTGTLLLQGRGRTMLAIIFLPIAMLCASIWKQVAYPITTMGYFVQLAALGIIVLGAQWAYIRGLDKTQKGRWFYRIACLLELLSLVMLGFTPQLEIHRARAIFFIGMSISAGGLALMSVPFILTQLTRKKKSNTLLQETSATTIMNKTYETNSPEGTHRLGAQLGTNLKTGDCIALIGNLGAGKTAFVRGLAEGLGCDVRLVSSPTYVLVQEYSSPDDKHPPLYHLDLYRLGDPVEEFYDLGVDEMLSNGIVVIEWADRATPVLPRPYTQISIRIDGPTTRKWTISHIDN
jgi:tRNA threonylcarbamoyladenosine biosynthesis protein TsaE